MESFTYDVFINHRGKDTRRGFSGYLYKALLDNGIRTFIDGDKKKKLDTEDQMPSQLLDPIVKTRIALTVFSANYASSTWCLDQLANIVDHVKGNNRFVIPVFYGVDPPLWRGIYENALGRHEEKFKDNIQKVQKWRIALQKVDNLSFWHFKHGRDVYEYEFIENIVRDVSSKIHRANLHAEGGLVGLKSRVQRLKGLLDLESDDVVRVIGVYGIGGIGKTTIARAVCNSIADQFDGFCFLDDVRRKSRKVGLVYLQEKLLSEIFGEKDIKLGSVSKGISIIRERLCRKKLLLVLDDVDELRQLQAVVGGANWFGYGSRVIITTRDKHVLETHGIERTYEVELLNDEEALELLRWKAFKSANIVPSVLGKLNRVISYTSGLPLALEVIGSNLFGKGLEKLVSTLDQYESVPRKDIKNILKVSFDALDEYEQSVFLDIAWCFKGYKLAEVEDILHSHYGDGIKNRIRVLVDKCLLKIEENGHVTLHDLTEDMAREIVRLESQKKTKRLSRLWFLEDIVPDLEGKNTVVFNKEVIWK